MVVRQGSRGTGAMMADFHRPKLVLCDGLCPFQLVIVAFTRLTDLAFLQCCRSIHKSSAPPTVNVIGNCYFDRSSTSTFD